jgi:PAS domain S-box-containing protein
MSAARATCSFSEKEIAETATSCVLVVKGNSLLGILTERDVVRLSAQGRPLTEIAIAEVMAHPVITLRRSEFTDIFTALNLLQAHHLRHLPLLDEGDRLIGILTHASLRQLLRPLDLLRLRLVSEVMTSQVIWAEPHTSMLRVAQLMAEHRVSCVAIASAEGNGKIIPIGIVTESDIVQFQSLGLDFNCITAQTVMSSPLFPVRPDDFLWTVQKLMDQRQIRRVVVTGKQGELLGIVTQTSLLQSLNPLELYKLVESLETKVSRLEAEKRAWLETRNVELEQEVQARTAQLQAQVKGEQLLAAIANRIRSSLNWQEILDTTVSEVRSLLGCDRVAIWQVQPDGSAIAVAESAASNRPSYLGRQVEDSCLITNPNRVTAYSNGRIRVVPDIYTTKMSDCHREFLAQLGIRAKILVPIVQGETLWGMLSVIESQAPRQWQTGEIGLLEQLATQLAIALQQATALQQAETELAERRRAEAALQWQIEFDRLIASISSHFVQFSPENMTNSINQALQDIGEFTQVDTSYIFQYSETQARQSMTHEWVAQGIPPQRQNAQNIPDRAFPWATAILRRGEIVHIPSVANLPVEAAIDRQSFQEFQIESILNIPLVDREKVVGFLGFASFHQECNWTDDNIRLLKIFAEILLNALQRQQAEAELQSSEQRYASLAKAAPVGIFRSDTQGSCVYVNDRWCQMTGLPAAASLGTGWAASIYPGDRDQLVSEWQRSIQKNSTFQQEFRVQHSEGQIYWVFAQAVAEYDAKEQIIGYVGTITDISDRKRRELEQQIVENTLLKSESLYRHLIQAQTDLILRSLPDTTITLANDALCFALGRTLEEVIGLRWSNFVPPEDLDELNRKIAALTPENPTFENINQDYRANNQSGWTQWINLGIFGDRGELVEIQSVGRDITALRQQIQREQALNRVFQSIRNSLDLNTIFATATAETAQLLKTLNCFVVQYLPEQGVWRHIAEFRHHRDTPTVIGLEIPDAGNPFAAQLKQFQLVRVEDTTNLDDRINQEIAQTIPGAWLLIPLVVEGSLWGSFTITTHEQPFIWDDDQVEIAQFVANQLEIAIQQANLYQQVQLELAERCRVEMALREREDRLKEAQQIAHLGSWELTLPTNTLLWSDEIYRIFEIDPQRFEATYEAFLEAIHPDDRAMVNQAYTDSLKNRTPYTIVHRLLMADGRIKYVQEQCQTFYDEQSQPIRSMGTVQDITERKQAEIALADSERRLSTLIGNLPGFVYRVRNDPNYTPEFLSQGVEAITGYRPEEYLVEQTISWGQQIHPDDADRVWQIIQAGVRDRQPYQCEYRILTKTGQEKWVWEGGKATYAEDNSLLWLEGFVTDISERKAVASELSYQKDLLQTTFDHLPVMVGVYSAKGEVLMINRELENVIGWNKAEYATVDVLRACYPNPADYEQVLTHIITADSTWKDFKTLVRDGRILDTSWAQIRLSDGRSIGIGQDITVLKAAQAALRDNEERLRLALTAANQGLYDLNIQTGETIVNAEYALMLGYEPAEFQETNANWIERLHPDDRESVAAIYRAYINREIPEYCVEFRQRTKIGDWKWILSVGKIVAWDEDGNPLRMLGTHTDISDRKQTELALLQSYQQYNNLVNGIPIGVYKFRMLADGQQRFDYVSPRWCALIQVSQEEVLQDASLAFQCIHPDELDRFIHLNDQVRSTLQSFVWEGRMVIGDEVRWMHIESSPTLLENGDIVWDGIQYDISDRKRAEEELQQKNTEMQAILAIFPDIFFRMAADGTILDYKARNTSDLYVPPEFFLNKRMQEVLPPNVAELISATIAQVLQTKLVISLEYSLPIGDREEYFEARFISFQEDQIVAIVRNISDRKAAEAALSQSEQRLQALLQHSSDIVSILDEQGNLVYNSPAAQRIHGFLPEDILGRNTFEQIHPDDRSRVAATFSRLLEEPASKVSVQYRYMTKEKGYVWMEAVASNQLHNPNIRGIVANSRDITERKLAEQALQDSENRLSNLIANLPGYVYRVANDPNYTPEFISEGVYQITGYRQEEYLLTRTISCGQEIHPDDAELIWNLVQQALERRQPYECEYRIITKTGETKWVWERGRGCWTQSGELLYLEGFVTDISDRKQAEATRLQAEKLQLELTLLEKILDIVLAGYWDWDIPNHKKYMSPGLKRMFGYEEAELPNVLETLQRLIFPEDLPGVLECFERHVGSHGEIPYYNEVRYRHKNGSTVWVICSGQVIEWDEQGNPLRMIGCHIDITKRKQAEVTMRRQLAAIEAAIEGIGILQGDTYLYLNQAYLDLLGYERPEELLGKPWRLLYAQEEIERFEREVFPVLGRDRSWQGEAIAIRKDGSTFAQGLSLTLTDDGLLICVCRDISDRKQAEEQIREKTLQLEATNRELESFSYSVSHDLRAPLRHINGFVNALRQQLEHNSALDNPKVVRYLETIENSSQRMALLIDGLLTLSRMGRRQIEYQPVKLRPLVEEAISFVQSNPGESTPVKFVLGNLPAASGDATLLQQVFCNLIGNAVKFSRNHPDPLVEIGSLPDNTIFVKDNGVGFSMDYADKLFGAFQRLHSQKEFEGTGIGLAIVQRIIHRHGGTIWAESQPDQGATFYFTIGNIKHDFPK